VPETGARLAAEARPRLAPKVRLRWDHKDNRYMLLADAIEREVLAFLHAMVERALIRTEP